MKNKALSEKPIPFKLPFQHYADLGYLPIPVVWGEKLPAGGAGWNTTEYDYAQLDAGRYSVGLLCDNIVGFDVDVADRAASRKLASVVRKTLGLRNAPVRIGQAPKQLLIARTVGAVKGWDIRHQKKAVFQLLGRGKQFVVHGIHPDTQKSYTLSRPLPAWKDLPLVDADKLEQLKQDLLRALEELGYDDLNATRAARSTKNAGWSDQHPWSEVGMNQAWDRLEKLDPDMPMHDWVMTGMALHDGTHGSSEGLEMWDMWSQGGDKYRSSRDLAQRWRGFRAGGTTKATLFKNDFARLHREPVVARRVDDDNDDEARPREEEEVEQEPNHFLSFDDLFDMDVGEVPWLVENMFTYGAHLLVGRPKGGKSWFTMDLACCVASGVKFMESPTQRSDVLWIASEDTQASLSRRLRVRGQRVRGGIHIMTMETLREERKEWDEDTSLDAWLRAFLEEHPSVGLVVLDTQATCEAVWDGDDEGSRNAVSAAYKKSRDFDEIGQDTETCVVLVHHMAKLKNLKSGVTDYHELINLPATVVAGATASLVLADLPDRDMHDEDNHRRVFAPRGRHIIREVPLQISIEDGRVGVDGEYKDIVQTEAQAEVFEVIESLLQAGERTTLSDVAKEMGKHRNTVQGALARAARAPGGMIWKGRTLVRVQGPGGGLMWKD